jgi:hypothetical protein
LRPRYGLVGPCWTAENARGQGVYPYTVACALQRLKEHGFDWGYISVRVGNEASIRGILKVTDWLRVGCFLMYRSPIRPFQIRAATIERPEATRLHSASSSPMTVAITPMQPGSGGD